MPSLLHHATGHDRRSMAACSAAEFDTATRLYRLKIEAAVASIEDSYSLERLRRDANADEVCSFGRNRLLGDIASILAARGPQEGHDRQAYLEDLNLRRRVLYRAFLDNDTDKVATLIDRAESPPSVTSCDTLDDLIEAVGKSA